MGISVLNLAQQTLEAVGFSTEEAYPGRKYPSITKPVAAIHLETVNRAELEVTLEVFILCPSSMGGTACEAEAIKATDALYYAGARCVQGGCSYDSAAQVFVTPIRVTFTGMEGEMDGFLGPGFQVSIDGVQMFYATAFTAYQESDHKIVYSIGVRTPEDSTAGPVRYGFRLEELIPTEEPEMTLGRDFFTLRLDTKTHREIFYGCRWTSVQREFTKAGLRRIRTGFARVWEVEEDGEN